MLLEVPELAYDTCFFIFEAREAMRGTAVKPFILYPSEQKLVRTLKYSIDNKQDVGVNKSREEGATETIIKFLTLYFMLVPNCSFLVGSEKEEKVDKAGTTKTLYSKIDQTLKWLPLWMQSRLQIERSHCKIRNAAIDTVIDGEATNENFGASGRFQAVFLDEFGLVMPSVAESIQGSIWDTTDTVIFNSTHWFGASHPFNKMLQRENLNKVQMLWYDNPTKSIGLYKTAKIDEVEILDKSYYIKNFPDFCSKVNIDKPFEVTNWVSSYPTFVADGCEKIPGDLRSVWHDKRERRSSTYREFCQNVWASPTGASDMFFDPVITARIRSGSKNPKYEGELEFEVEKRRVERIGFKLNTGRRSLKIWSDLSFDKGVLRLNQLHNYIVGCDIGFGTGASNSVAEITDVNTGENVGELVCADKSPEEFADLCVALCKWIGGGTGEAFIIFENNGGQGANFGKRLRERGLNRIYTQTTETNKTRKQTDKFGWHSGRESKEFVLSLLSGALKEGLKTSPQATFIKVYNSEMVNDLDSFVFYESGEIDAEERQDLTSGARKRHGDRVIGLALCVLGMRDQKKLGEIPYDKIPYNSIAWRRKNRELREKELKDAESGWQEPTDSPVLKGWNG